MTVPPLIEHTWPARETLNDRSSALPDEHDNSWALGSRH